MASRGEIERPQLLNWLAMLSDPVRVRLLRLLEGRELSVGDLGKALQLPQSTVSRHLKVLFEHHWVVKRQAGTASLYRMATDLPAEAQQLWQLTLDTLGQMPTFEEDSHRLQQMLTERHSSSRDFFGQIGGEWDRLRQEMFGEAATPHALLHLLDPTMIVADLGCGTGNITALLAPHVAEVIAIDREAAMLTAAKKRLAGAANVRFLAADVDGLPLDDHSVDVVILSLILHHLKHPQRAIVEGARILRPGGVMLIIDMVAHDRETYRHTMGHEHLGFDEAAVRAWMEPAGFQHLTWRRLPVEMDAQGPGLFAAALR